MKTARMMIETGARKRQRWIVEPGDERDAHDDSGHDIGHHQKSIERTRSAIPGAAMIR